MPFSFQPKDFIETPEGLAFAVVLSACEQGRILSQLRYRREHGQWHKLTSEQADQLLRAYHPNYRYYSVTHDVLLHGVPVTRLQHHYQPRARLQALLQSAARDAVHEDLKQLAQRLQRRELDLRHWGITGSLLIGAQQASSDIDLVSYDRRQFQHARQLLHDMIANGEITALSAQDWQVAYQRRGCDLTFDEYYWHERRKANKGLINGRKFDLSLIDESPYANSQSVYRKQGRRVLRARVTDARFAYDHPAVYYLDHPTIMLCACYTATYVGQAETGEIVEIAGLVEHGTHGARIIVGSSREARGEYLRVISNA